MAITLVPKMCGSGLQVNRQASSNTRNVYVPPVQTRGEGHHPYQSPPFIVMGKIQLEWGKERTRKRQRTVTGSKQSLQFNSNSRLNFVNKPLSNFNLFDWIKKLGIKHFLDILSRDVLPKKIEKECGIVTLDDNQGPGTHWVCYRNLDSFVEYFNPFGLIMPHEVYHYLASSGKRLIYCQDEVQNRDSVLCGYWCLYYLNER